MLARIDAVQKPEAAAEVARAWCLPTAPSSSAAAEARLRNRPSSAVAAGTGHSVDSHHMHSCAASLACALPVAVQLSGRRIVPGIRPRLLRLIALLLRWLLRCSAAVLVLLPGFRCPFLVDVAVVTSIEIAAVAPADRRGVAAGSSLLSSMFRAQIGHCASSRRWHCSSCARWWPLIAPLHAGRPSCRRRSSLPRVAPKAPVRGLYA